MTTHTNRTLMTLAILITLTSTSFAQQMGKRGLRNEGRLQIRQELNLTDEQEAKMKDMRLEQEEKMIDLRADQKKAQFALKKLMSDDDPKKKKIYAQVDKIAAIDAKIEKTRIDHRLEVRSILTDEQLEVFQKTMFMQGRRGGFDGREKRGQRDGACFPHRRF